MHNTPPGRENGHDDPRGKWSRAGFPVLVVVVFSVIALTAEKPRRTEAFLEDLDPGAGFQVMRDGKALPDVAPQGALGMEFFEHDRIIVRSGYLKLRFLHSGRQTVLRPESHDPGGAVAFVVEQDSAPSLLTKVHEGLVSLWKSTAAIQEATHPKLITRGLKVRHGAVFPPDGCTVARDGTLLWSWPARLVAPTLEIMWDPAGRSVTDLPQDRAIYARRVGDLLPGGDTVPPESEITLHWRLTDPPTKFDVGGHIMVQQPSATEEVYVWEQLRDEAALRWKLGQLLQEKRCLSARETLAAYLQDNPEAVGRSEFVAQAAQLLHVLPR